MAGRPSKELAEIKQLAKTTRYLELAVLDMSRRAMTRNNRTFDPCLWEVAQSTDFQTMMAIFTLFAGKTVTFPSYDEFRKSIYRASALADWEDGMSSEKLKEKYSDTLGPHVLSGIQRLRTLRDLGDTWKDLYSKIIEMQEGRDD